MSGGFPKAGLVLDALTRWRGTLGAGCGMVLSASMASAAPPPSRTGLDPRLPDDAAAEQIIVHARRPHFTPAPLPGGLDGAGAEPSERDPQTGAATSAFGSAYGAAAPVPAVNPAGNWPPQPAGEGGPPP